MFRHLEKRKLCTVLFRFIAKHLQVSKPLENIMELGISQERMAVGPWTTAKQYTIFLQILQNNRHNIRSKLFHRNKRIIYWQLKCSEHMSCLHCSINNLQRNLTAFYILHHRTTMMTVRHKLLTTTQNTLLVMS